MSISQPRNGAKFIMLSAITLACTLLSAVAVAETDFIAVEDALVNTSNNINYTGQFSNVLASETGPSNGYWGSWIKFDVNPIVGLSVQNAYLDLHTHFNHSSTPIDHEVFFSTVDSWSESTITGENQPSNATLTLLSAITIPNVNATYTWDVTSALNSSAAQSDGIISFLVRPKLYPITTSRGPHFDSTEFGNSPPLLRVSPVPEPSSMLMMFVGLACVGIYSKYSKRAQIRKDKVKPTAASA